MTRTTRLLRFLLAMFVPGRGGPRMTPARFDFRRGYRIQRRIAQGDVAAIRERDALTLAGRLDMFWPRLALLNRGMIEREDLPLFLRKVYGSGPANAERLP